MIARRVLHALVRLALARRATTPAAPGLDDPATEHDLVDARAPRAAGWDEAARLVRGETDTDLAALALYGPALQSPDVRSLLRRLGATRT